MTAETLKIKLVMPIKHKNCSANLFCDKSSFFATVKKTRGSRQLKGMSFWDT